MRFLENADNVLVTNTGLNFRDLFCACQSLWRHCDRTASFDAVVVFKVMIGVMEHDEFLTFHRFQLGGNLCFQARNLLSKSLGVCLVGIGVGWINF